MKTTGVIIARFQTPYLHEGHKNLINNIKANHNKIVVVLGITQASASKRNPFDFYSREKMLREFMPELTVLPITDNASDKIWSENLDNLLQSTFTNETFVLYGSRDSFIPHYTGKLQTKEIEPTAPHSSTEVRANEADKVLGTLDFRLGVNYAIQNLYPIAFTTVDVAVYNQEGTKLLLGRKPNAKAWRLPGGFTDPTDDNFEAAAKRELTEECGAIETDKMEYVTSAKIDDWRYRKEENKIITLLYKTTLVYGNPKAGDDLEEVKWVEISQLQEMIENNTIAYEHKPLIATLITHHSTQKQ